MGDNAGGLIVSKICWKRLAVAVLSAALALPACTTLRDVPMPVSTATTHAPNVHAGDVVRVTLRSGEKKKFKVTVVTSDALLGTNVRVPFEEIQNLQKRENSGWKSAMLISAGAVVVLAGLLMYAILNGLDDGD
jgi:hypothetical protein